MLSFTLRNVVKWKIRVNNRLNRLPRMIFRNQCSQATFAKSSNYDKSHPQELDQKTKEIIDRLMDDFNHHFVRNVRSKIV